MSSRPKTSSRNWEIADEIRGVFNLYLLDVPEPLTPHSCRAFVGPGIRRTSRRFVAPNHLNLSYGARLFRFSDNCKLCPYCKLIRDWEVTNGR